LGKVYILVEGHGELGAADNLISRLSANLGLNKTWAPARRWKNLHHKAGFVKGTSFIRSKADVDGLLILRDEDDACPRERGPEMAAWLRELQLPFPAAVVLLHPEYEVLFLPCLERMAGKTLGTGAAARPGLILGARWEGDWESRRGIKEWLTAHFPPGRSYKPTLDQLPLTRLVEFEALRKAELACFGTLERSLAFLARGNAGEVYPARYPQDTLHGTVKIHGDVIEPSDWPEEE
jgi:hypothetical protein